MRVIEPAAGAPKKKRRRWGAFAAIAAMVILGAGYGHMRGQGPKVPVAKVERKGLVQKVVMSGRVMAPARINLGTLLTGTAAEVLAEEGQAVKAGELLVRMDDRELRAAVAQAKAGVEQASAKLGQLRSVGARMASESLRQAKVALEQAQKKKERVEALSVAGSASRAELDDAHSALELAQSRLVSADAQAQSMGSGGSDYRLAAASVSQAQAALEAAEARLSQARILAPVDAVVLSRKVEPGDAVGPGRVLLVLARTGATYLSAQPDEKNLALLVPGQTALASTEAFPAESFAAKISTVAPSIDAERGTVEVKLTVPEPPPYLRPDMTVSIEVEVARVADALVIPSEAVRELPTRSPWVMLLKGELTERREISVGIIGDGRVEVKSGLKEGDEVVPVTPFPVSAGQKVRPQRAKGS